MKTDIWQWLQIFAGEGGGDGGASAGDGAAAATGEMADAAGQRLRDLGVPENKIRKQKANRPSSLPQGAIRNSPAQEPVQQAAPASDEEAQEQEPTKDSPKYDWDEVMKDPEMNKHMQEVVKSRVKEANTASEALRALEPALKKFASENGLDAENLDYVAIGKALNGEYEAKAAELGVSKEVAMQLDQQSRTLEQQRIAAHLQQLEQQGQALKAVFPNFDLMTEMQNPTFRRLTAPNMGMSVEDAYHAVHRKEIEAAKAKAVTEMTTRQIANNIAARGRRPDESGKSSQAPSVTTFDYRNATKEQRDELKARIRNAHARGEKIYPGTF